MPLRVVIRHVNPINGGIRMRWRASLSAMRSGKASNDRTETDMRGVLPWGDRGSESGLHSGAGRGGSRRLQALVAPAATALVMLSAATAAQAIGTGSVEGTVTNHKAEDLKGIEVTV